MLKPKNIYNSPTKGKLTVKEIISDISDFINQDTRYPYRIIIGSDSQNHKQSEFVAAIIVHRVGNGARYYFQRLKTPRIIDLRPRIYEEAMLSIAVASTLFKELEKELDKLYNLAQKPELEIHIDIGRTGKTRELIKEVVGMIQGNGYTCKIKPDSFGASKVADRYT